MESLCGIGLEIIGSNGGGTTFDSLRSGNCSSDVNFVFNDGTCRFRALLAHPFNRLKSNCSVRVFTNYGDIWIDIIN